MQPATNDLRVALLTGSLSVGGAEKQLLYTARSLHDMGINTRVYSFASDGLYKHLLQSAGIPVVVINQKKPLLRLLVLARQLVGFKPHIIQTAQLFTGIYAGLAGTVVHASSIVNMRNELVYEMRIGRRMLALSVQLPSALIANSQKAIDEILAAGFIDVKSTYLLPNVIDLANFDASVLEAPNLPNGFRVVFVGRLTSQKRVDRFLRVLLLAKKQVPNVVGIIVGDGPDADTLRTQAANLNVAVTFLGVRNDIPDILRHCQVLILCSDYEGFPNVLIEAMAARLPTITTPAGDSSRVVVDGETGYVVPFDDVEVMAAKISTLAHDPVQHLHMSEAGRLRVETLYSYASLSERLLDIYYDLGQKDQNLRLITAIQHIKSYNESPS